MMSAFPTRSAGRRARLLKGRRRRRRIHRRRSIGEAEFVLWCKSRFLTVGFLLSGAHSFTSRAKEAARDGWDAEERRAKCSAWNPGVRIWASAICGRAKDAARETQEAEQRRAERGQAAQRRETYEAARSVEERRVRDLVARQQVMTMINTYHALSCNACNYCCPSCFVES